MPLGSNLNELHHDLSLIEARIARTTVDHPDALMYWFEQLDESKKDLLQYGKLEVIANDQ